MTPTRDRLAGGMSALARIREAVDLACEGFAVTFYVRSGSSPALMWLTNKTGRVVLTGDYDALVEVLPAVREIYQNQLANRMDWPIVSLDFKESRHVH